MLHTRGPLASTWCRCGLLRKGKVEAVDSEHGCVPGRRREGAILVYAVGAHKLTKAGYDFIASNYDSANAFTNAARMARGRVMAEITTAEDLLC